MNTVKLSLVTFVSGVEVLTDDFLDLANKLQLHYNAEILVFVNQIHNINHSLSIQQIISKNTTKYNRIQQLLLETKMDYCLCIDNDITPNSDEIIKFIQESFSSGTDLSWGQIGVKSSSLMTNMIKIDKFLSHSIIRPLLWRFGVGASIPGQVFLIKPSTFRDRLPKNDTLFDDLTIGICARENNVRVYFKKAILGWEKPKENILSLLHQRIRWAKGFAQVVNSNRKNLSKLYLVIMHGVAYHFLLFFLWALIYSVSFIAIKYAIVLWSILILMLTFGHASLSISALAYTIVFPIIHTVWLATVIYNSAFSSNDNRK